MRELIRKGGAVSAILAATAVLGLSGCGSAHKAPERCAAITQEGAEIHPHSYPLGVVAVSYEADYGKHQTEGVITDKPYRLDVKDLPPNDELGSKYEEFSEDVVVVLRTPETGRIGITNGCREDGVDPNGIRTSFFILPTTETP